MAQLTATCLKLEVHLAVSSLPRALEFYTQMWGCPPVRTRPTWARFDLEDPPLALMLLEGTPEPAGAFNHLGWRLANAEELVEWQQRLESRDIKTDREEDVECCYSWQTKFWITDPDGYVWEVYTLDTDEQDESPALTAANISDPSNAATEFPQVWGHRRDELWRLPELESHFDEIHLENSFSIEGANSSRFPSSSAQKSTDDGADVAVQRLIQILVLLKPGATLSLTLELHHLDQILTPCDWLQSAGFTLIQVDRLHQNSPPTEQPAIDASAADTAPARATYQATYSASRPVPALETVTRGEVLYLGPASSITLPSGLVLQRGYWQAVRETDWNSCQSPPHAVQFCRREFVDNWATARTAPA